MSKKKRARAQPRRRVIPLWRSRWVVLTVVLLVAGGAIGGGSWLWRTGWVARTAEQARQRLIAASGEVGLRVQEILVVGRRETRQRDLLAALRFGEGAPLLAIDLEAARGRVEALPWVKRATVERLWPDTILVSVDEHRPLALWQYKGRFALIDRQGEVILKKGVERFSHLPVVVGEGAPAHAAELLKMLSREPQLMARVRAAVWVGDRRWNVRTKNGIDVRLPEENPGRAWAKLAEYERRHRILGKDIKVLDLRLPDRLIVRRAKRRGGAGASGRET